MSLQLTLGLVVMMALVLVCPKAAPGPHRLNRETAKTLILMPRSC
jgi:hypothetical protein